MASSSSTPQTSTNELASRQARLARFANFTNLVNEMKENDVNPHTILTRLYNGMTTDISKAEAEITRLKGLAQGLSDELTNLKGTAIQVSLQHSKASISN